MAGTVKVKVRVLDGWPCTTGSSSGLAASSSRSTGLLRPAGSPPGGPVGQEGAAEAVLVGLGAGRWTRGADLPAGNSPLGVRTCDLPSFRATSWCAGGAALRLFSRSRKHGIVATSPAR
jgi:hypothetical protein